MKAAKVIEVSDGDTLKADYFGLVIVLRVSCIDAPELGKNLGKEAKKFMESLVLEKQINFQELRKDSYNRYIADCYIEGKRLDELMVSNGLAWHWAKYSNNIEVLDKLQAEAQKQELNIWQPEHIEARKLELLRKFAINFLDEKLSEEL